ncbi:phosphoesterase RecJ domain protein [Methanothermus fervidus DSM 2088]|uniref:Phosphoesterase RecJ domain protein n=1 Tax=Methanothermus fervidus (strain ATCC 43054 / DSM 2088 / JCM 10308 / V24 S) TaxID=523846 RepID=E3GX87_METFV|nr:single-stranded-DNA-specific exonuclease RecJ [Methanothermus fervidus]ADP78082.1 phosphoesterase RecJ domain protein [Methanothermus fervidus DSM 2088]
MKSELLHKFLHAKKVIEEAENVNIYTHIDCDGICAGAILSYLMEELGKDYKIEFINIDEIDGVDMDSDLTIFSDLGSGQELEEKGKILILDHHPPIRKPKDDKNFIEINPMFYGIDGSTEISGGGLAYLLSKTFNLKELSWIGVLSAIGDMQNSIGQLRGLNRYILNDSISLKLLKVSKDLTIYGRQTRPIHIALSYFNDVKLPITNNKTECILLLKKLKIPRKDGEKWRTLSDLNGEEKKKLFIELIKMLNKEVPRKYSKYLPKLISGEVYDFLPEERYSLLRDLTEFSTAINACSRNKKFDIALKILKGERGNTLKKLEKILREHRRYLAKSVKSVRYAISQEKNLQYFIDDIKPEAIGSVANLALSYGDWRKPILGLTYVDENYVKVSLRCSRLFYFKNIHFGKLIKKISEKVGGNGGGHAVACGAYIPQDREADFIDLFDQILDNKLGVPI